MNEIQVFNYDSRQVRTVEKNGEAWFVGKDVASILEYKNPQKAIRDHVDKEDRTVNEMFTVNGTSPILINESGLYSLIFSSKLPSAKKFKHWVTSEVLPEIRRKGYYAVPAVQSQIDDLKKQNELLQAQNTGLKKYIQENSSFTLLGQAITPLKGIVSFGEGAKLFSQNGIKTGQNRLIKKARDKKLLARRKGRQHNQPTQWAIDKGYCVLLVPIGSKGTPYLTMKGMQFLANELAQEQFPLLALITDAEALHE